MTTKIKREILKPLYYDKFSCINVKCEDNCCKRAWGIHIDKTTYLKYRNIKNPEFRKKQEKCVKRIRGVGASDLSYAQFVFADDNRCPFQAEDGLCEIHRDFGPDFLCRTCRYYPRLLRVMTPENYELSVTMSCPNAVRTALFDKNPMEFTIETMEFNRNEPLLGGGIKPGEGKRKTHYIKYGWQMREAAITIMQIRTCSVAHRIIIIAMMLEDVVKAHDEGKHSEIPGILDFYSQGTYGKAFMDEFNDMEPNDNIKLQVNALLYFTVSLRSEAKQYPTFIKFASNYDKYANKKGLNEEEKENALEYHEYCKQNEEKNWSKFLADWEYVLENYLVSFMFSEIFPLKYHNKDLNPYHHAFILAEQYVLLRMILTGNYESKVGYTKKYITTIISQIALLNQHSPEPQKIAENFRIIGIDTPAHLFYLLL